MTEDEAMAEKALAAAAAEMFRRHVFRLAEKVHGGELAKRHYPFTLLLHEVRGFVKYCEDQGFDDIDLMERLVVSFYAPHPSRFEPPDLEYLLAMIALNSAFEGRVAAVEHFVSVHRNRTRAG